MSIKGHNSVANLQKTMIYNLKVDHVNDNVHTKFGLNRSIKGPNSVANLPKFELIQAVTHVLVIKKIQSKKKG